MKRTIISLFLILICTLGFPADTASLSINGKKTTPPPRMVLTNIYEDAGEYGWPISNEANEFTLVAEKIPLKSDDLSTYVPMFQLSIFSSSASTNVSVTVKCSGFTPVGNAPNKEGYHASFFPQTQYFVDGNDLGFEGHDDTHQDEETIVFNNIFEAFKDVTLEPGQEYEFRLTGRIAFGSSQNNYTRFKTEVQNGAQYMLTYQVTVDGI